MAGGGEKLKAGEVVRMRVNPRDCISALDVLDAANINYRAMSFAQCISLAFSSLLETARQNGLIEEPDGFEFLNRMAQFKTSVSASHRKKMEITAAMQEIGSRIHVPAIDKEIRPPPTTVDTRTTEQRLAGRMLHELCEKLDLSQKNPDVKWQQSDQEEYDRLFKIVYPEG